MKTVVERKFGDHTLSIETGQLAKQAAGAVLVRYGETAVIVAAATGAPRAGIDFFPLTCD
jgi:polyribonucleotide nucleotidyltransferase